MSNTDSVSPTAEYTPQVPENTKPASESLFDYMSTEYDWLSPNATMPFPTISEPSYNFSQWNQQDQKSIPQSDCTNPYDSLMQSESSANKLLSSPLGKQSIKNALGVGDCVTHNTKGTTSAILGLYKTGYQSSFSKGCAGVALNVAMNYTMSNQLSCSVISTNNQVQNKEIDIQQVNVVIKGATFEKSANFNLSQDVNSTTKCLDFTDVTVKSNMVNSLKNNINNLQKSFSKKSYTGNEIETQPGERQLNSVVTAAIQSSTKIDFESLINKAVSSVFQAQGENFVLIDPVFEGAVNIDTNQGIVQNTIVSSIVKNATQEIMKQSGIADIKDSQTNKNLEYFSENDSILSIVLLVLSILFIPLSVYFKKKNDKRLLKYLFCISLVLFLCCVVFFTLGILSSDTGGRDYSITTMVSMILFFIDTVLSFCFYRQLGDQDGDQDGDQKRNLDYAETEKLINDIRSQTRQG